MKFVLKTSNIRRIYLKTNVQEVEILHLWSWMFNFRAVNSEISASMFWSWKHLLKCSLILKKHLKLNKSVLFDDISCMKEIVTDKNIPMRRNGNLRVIIKMKLLPRAEVGTRKIEGILKRNTNASILQSIALQSNIWSRHT